MTRGRRRFVPPPGPAGSPLDRRETKPKPNRLSRSFRQTQQSQSAAEAGSPKSPEPDFKTPTRVSRTRVVPAFSGESPHNEGDFQQDIIWDATSPSPGRLGKRGKKHAAGIVDISEIVSRIAPKHGRPKVAEPTLQQWIGDSAAIPCTPDVQVPKPKKKSPRPSGVDDLLKLAKQFDFNMFHQEDEQEGEDGQRNVELLSGDILELDTPGHDDVSASLPKACGADVQVNLDQMEDNLEFLFDGPTQHLSGNLSQMSAAPPSQFISAPTPSSKTASRTPSSHGPSSKRTSANGEFGEDWDDDDLLNDSLVFEMTQNPQNFIAPNHCSTQKPVSDVKYQTSANVCVGGSVKLDQNAVSNLEKEPGRQRTTFKLDPNPDFCVRRISKDSRTSTKVDFSSKPVDKDCHLTRFSSSESFSVQTGSQQPHQSNSEPQKLSFNHRTSASRTTAAFSVSNSVVKKPTQSFSKEPDETGPSVSDFLDEDLDLFFSSDLVWDDPADDDMLCEMCDDLENQIQSLGNTATRCTVPDVQTSQQKVLQPSNRITDNRNRQAASGPAGGVFKQSFLKETAFPSVSGKPAGGPMTAGSASMSSSTVKNSFNYMQTKTASGSTTGSTSVQGSSRVQLAAAEPRSGFKNQFTFKKPNNPVSTLTNKGLGKCSEAEIELKKQQAMERRRQRLQAAQNLRAPN